MLFVCVVSRCLLFVVGVRWVGTVGYWLCKLCCWCLFIVVGVLRYLTVFSSFGSLPDSTLCIECLLITAE